MKPVIRKYWFLVIAVLLALSACGGGKGANAADDSAPVFTQIALTALAMQTETAQAASPTPTVTDTPQVTPTPKVTNTPAITTTLLTNAPTSTPLVLSTPKTNSQSVCDNVDSNIIDVTIPDGTEITPGATFVKTWEFKNLGPCEWDQDYLLIFSYGNATDVTGWDGTKPVNFPDVVEAGDSVQISVTLTAPTDEGAYRGVFRLQNDSGFNFGPEFWLEIVVK